MSGELGQSIPATEVATHHARRRGRDRFPGLTVAACALIAAMVIAAAVLRGIGVWGGDSQPPVGYGYWHTSGTTVLDSLNRPVRIAAVTWFGAETSTWVPGGLDLRRYQRILNEVKALGYNTVRLPFSNQLVEQNPVVWHWLRANPELRGKHALTIMDDIVRYAGRIGLKIILDDQISASESADPTRPREVTRLDEPLWYTTQYPERAWVRDWKRLALRYRENSTVIGFDLRNEPHTACSPGLVVQNCVWDVATYLSNGSTWGPYRGIENRATDWRLAAERAGDAVLKLNPKLLIFVEGLQLYPAADQPHGIDSYWWGGILRQVRQYPIVLHPAHQLVYSPHEYGPEKWPYYAWWRNLTYGKLAAILNLQWGFILQHPHAGYAAPIFLGETGTCTNYPSCVSAGRAPYSASRIVRIKREQGKWLHLLVRYLREHRQIGWSLWALNGTNALDQVATDGLLNPRWNGVQVAALQRLLSTIQPGGSES